MVFGCKGSISPKKNPFTTLLDSVRLGPWLVFCGSIRSLLRSKASPSNLRSSVKLSLSASINSVNFPSYYLSYSRLSTWVVVRFWEKRCGRGVQTHPCRSVGPSTNLPCGFNHCLQSRLLTTSNFLGCMKNIQTSSSQPQGGSRP